MKNEYKKFSLWHRISALALAAVMLVGMLPYINVAQADSSNTGITTVADPETLTRPETIYGDNTVNAGKVTVGKSVSTTDVTVNGQTVTLDGENNFLITISQSAQVMGLSSESSTPVDVVFVLDTSGSMGDNSRAETLVTAANSAISTLMSANEHNRVAVVAFSSEGYGGGTSNGAAANVLSSLDHYTGTAATAHLQWVNDQGGTTGQGRSYIAGRDTVTTSSGSVNAYRNGKNGGTNIQAGIIEGAKVLTSVTNTTYTDPDTDETVTRIPFLIILSDGQPTFSYDDDTWYDPILTGNDAADEQGPGSDAYEGNGFIAAITAAYYKGLITEHYYGDKAGGDDHCYVYTMGVEIDSLTGDEKTLAQITLDPATYTTGNYAAENASSYWNYGNTADDNTKVSYYGWKTYWNSYLAGNDFYVRVDSGSQNNGPGGGQNDSQGTYIWIGEGEPEAYYEMSRPREPGKGATQAQWNQYYTELAAYEAWQAWVAANFVQLSGEMYTFTAESIANSKQYVSSIAYNDAYFNADSVSQMQAAFEKMVTTIQQKAISVPTKVTSGDHDFDGYVTFTDPLGEYMEVKDMKGILAGGYFYQGASFAQKLVKFGTENADTEFDALLVKVLQSRMKLTESSVDVNTFTAQALASENQAYYNSAEDYDNSIVWWGSVYNSDEEDEQVQVIGFADNDSVEYIEAQKAAGAIPAGADYVCRSYFFYGEAGGANPNPDHEYLYFMVRVQRELTAPYRETVVISAPASLLSMERVLITEAVDDEGNTVYTAAVEHQEPARVIYEVGLWDSITAENVSTIVSSEYASETVNGSGSVNYDAETDTYYFFTNDWDRTQTLESHQRALAKATFDAAVDNEFYTYQEDTLIVDEDGKAVTADPAGTTAYYVREYYEWASDNGTDGTYTATKKTALIKVDIPADAELTEKNGQWYIPQGAYTSATLVVDGDDTVKTENTTGTSSIVAHPYRTGDASNSHYTVFLGNNGMLSLQADTYEPQKTVSVNLSASATDVVDGENKAVKVGDVLTYTVEVKNILTETADITVTDYVPLGTAFVEGSAGVGTDDTGHVKDASIKPDSNNVLTWVLEDVPAGATYYVSFQTVVTETALSLTAVPGNIENTAQVRINNGVNVSTNTTSSPVYGKSVTDVSGQNINGSHGYKVGDTLVYHIRFHNNAKDANGNYIAADVTVTDQIPEGTTFVSADNGGVYNDSTGTVTWSFKNVAANTSNVVSFQVKINASAKAEEAPADQADGIEPASGEIYLPNTATIVVNDASVTTNTTENWADVGNMVISKLVATGGDQTKTFTLHLTESTGLLSGKYPVSGGDASYVEFVGGKASVSIKHGQELTVQGLPAGVIISVEEDVSSLPGWTPTYNTQSVTIVKGAATAVSSVSVTNTYTVQPLTITVKGVKTLTGAALTSQAIFGFVAEPDSSNPVVGDPLTGEVTVKAAGEYQFTLSAKTFTKPGVYTYTVSEINGSLLGVTYDDTAYVLVINVTDNGDGTMSATATVNNTAFDLDQDALSFTNAYAPEETQLELTAKKLLSGRSLITGEFHFQITDGTNTYKGFNDKDGNIVFEAITFHRTGTYNYTMSEVVPDTRAEGVSYDKNTYAIQVVVTDEGGWLSPTVTVDGQAVTVVDSTADTGVTFQNTFEPDDVPLTVVANKTLKTYDPTTGTYVDATAEAGKFRFQIKEKVSGDSATTGTNAADGTITFNTFYFSADMLDGVAAGVDGSKTRDITYVISEVVPVLAKDPNMYYDLNGYEFTVTLTYAADGTLTVSVNGDSDGVVDLTDSADFVNYGNPSSVEVRPVGTKTTDDAPSGVSFSFSVVDTADGNEVAAGVGDANGSINFSTLSFSETGIYTYWILESNAGNTTNGITYDASRYLMKVVVSRNSYNRLVATVTYWSSAVDGSVNVADYTVSATAPSFHNEYHAGGYINLTATKKLEGRDLAEGEFAFKLVRQDNGGEIDGIVDANGKITFSTLYYSGADIPAGQTSAVIHYVMSEVVPTTGALPGVTYDTGTYDVYVRITDNGNGKISAELVKPNGNGGYTAISGTDTGVVFENTYAPVEGDVIKYQILKDLDGRDIRAGEFEFGLYLDGETEPVDVASNDENGIVTFFRTIPATAGAYAGTYKMVIRELSGTVPGVKYSTQEYTIYVKITDNVEEGKIEATVHLTEDGPALAEDANGIVDLTDVFVFQNTYSAHGTTYTPEAVKKLSGRTLIAGEFSFQAQLISKNGVAVSNGTVYTGVNAANGNVVFETIPYSETGTYIYRLSEKTGAASGVKYDSTVYYLKVVVTDDGNGHLKAAAGYYSDEACENTVSAATFTNSYTPAAAKVELEATKVLTGRDLKDKEFSFVVRQNNITGKIVATGNNDAHGNIQFSTFDITAADMAGATQKTFTYVVMESDNQVPGVTVDKKVFTVTVTVTDDGTGALNAQVSYPDDEPIVFENTYKPAPTELPLVAYKTLTGKKLGDEEFTFMLVNTQDATESYTATNDENGVISFGNLKFEAAGTYIYTLSEAVPDPKVDGMNYDLNTYTIKVEVKDVNAQLVATATYADDEGTVQLIRFTNSYTPSAITVELEGTKSITDANGTALTDSKYSLAGFEFEVRDTEGKLLTTAVSDLEGKIKITGLSFATAGEYRFLVSEKATDRDGYSTDPTVWCVHITIGYNADTGKLYEAGEYIHLAPEAHDGTAAQASSELSFVNVYDPADVNLTLKIMKDLDGRTLRDREFTFYVVDRATGLRAAESHNHANGEVNLRLTYTEPGTYNYIVCEEKPADDEKLSGVTYSQEAYYVTVIVTDEGTGELKAQVGQTTAVGDGTVDLTGSVVFHNTYTPAPVDVTVEAMKVLDGKGLTAGIFSFALVNVEDADDKYIAKNDVNGKITFEAITFEKAGVYKYSLTEVIGNAGGVTYDATAYTVTITVTDDSNGKLHATVNYTRSAEGTEAAPVFRNSYRASKVGVQLTAVKELAGKDLVGGDFTFELKDSTGAVIQATNDANGNIVFGVMEYAAEGTYQYTMYEVAGSDKNITYDDTVYTITVTVTDDGEGSLEAEVVYTKDDAKVQKAGFYNKYTETVTPPTGDDTPVAAYIGLTVISALALAALFLLRRKEGNKTF